MFPVMKKAGQVAGANVLLRNASVDDAEFILALRLDPHKRRYLSPTSASLDDQISWLRHYETDATQAYFVVCDRNLERLGCVRMYDPFEASYCWGSWLMRDGVSPVIALESVLLVYAYGRHLGFRFARFAVRKDNVRVWRFHERTFSADRVRETDLDYHFVLIEEKIEASLRKFSRLITHPLAVSASPGPGTGVTGSDAGAFDGSSTPISGWAGAAFLLLSALATLGFE